MNCVKAKKGTPLWFRVLGGCLAIVVLVSFFMFRKVAPNPDEEYLGLFKKIDKENNKIDKALKEYKNPKTSVRRKSALAGYISHADIKTPEDKLLLKNALRDPQYLELRDTIQMGLLHAIQRKPEESDKEYILELLRAGENNVGWLYYAMLNVWDDRFIPFLLEGAQQGALSDIEILGRQHVKEAIPVLEELRSKGNPSVQRDVEIALAHIRENN